MTDTRFEGRTAIVTGASRGIGLAVAARIVSGGGRVCITARNADALAEAVESLGGPDHAMAVAGKADDPDHRAEAVARTVETFGSLDVLVNNTGINPAAGPLLDLDLGAARKILEVNVVSALGWVQQAHRAWMAEHGGTVVNVASVAGLRPAADIGFYGSSKAALIHLTQQLAAELGPGVRVNAVAPAVVKTRFATMLFEGHEDEVVARYPMRRLGEPDDVAGAVAYLASDEASWVTGHVLVVDGGLTLSGGV
ncbi:MAG: glucose 1-dehydrogenase [Frankiales bacterium]|nr:glucose 1-dehydrogenase [Frankiales bacterium]